MKRNAFTMKLKPGFAEEYKKRHEEIWPELSEQLKEAGVHDYSIYLDVESLTLFAFQKLEDSYDGKQLASHPVVRKWWDYMADIMDTNPDNSPVTQPLREVFHMD
ncbi:L-rhamnose mutarotase [Catalinimonas sp. 4WD22]|uniref:L-rhamnose mutarotase n=1 Tax=Catalinimonas locisalis TaxID=3133978 RepID=UPI003100B002